MMPYFVHQFTHEVGISETCHKFPSVTVPDQELSIEELLKRHQMGLLTDVDFPDRGVYSKDAHFDDQDLEKVTRMDLIDQGEFLAAGREALRLQALEAAEASEKKRLADYNEAVDKAVAAKLAALASTPPA